MNKIAMAQQKRAKKLHRLKEIYGELKSQNIREAEREELLSEENRLQVECANLDAQIKELTLDRDLALLDVVDTPSLRGKNTTESAQSSGAPRRTRTVEQPPTGRTYVDSSNRPVVVLGANDSYEHLQRHLSWRHSTRSSVTGQTLDPSTDLSVGRAIHGIVTGRWDEAGLEMQALAGGGGTSGGYAMHPILSAKIIDLARPKSVIFRAGAQIVDMPASELIMARVTGDPTTAWYGENKTIATSEPTLGRLTFRARKLATIIPFSRELMMDSPNAVQVAENLIAEAVAQELDRAAFFGSGAGEEGETPTGIFEHSGVQPMTSIGTITFDDFLDAIKLVEDENGQPNAYVFNPSVKNSLSKLKGTDSVYLVPPVEMNPLTRYLSTKFGDSQALLADFTKIMVGIRLDTTIERSVEAGDAFAKDQFLIKIVWRGDIQLEQPEHFVTMAGIS